MSENQDALGGPALIVGIMRMMRNILADEEIKKSHICLAA